MWPTDEVFRHLTLAEVQVTVEAEIRRRGGRVVEGLPDDEAQRVFRPGEPLPVDIPDDLVNPEALPEPLLRRIQAAEPKSPGGTR